MSNTSPATIGTARLVKVNDTDRPLHFAATYKLEPPLGYTYTDYGAEVEDDEDFPEFLCAAEYVYVSAASLPFPWGLEDETYIFHANEDGEVLNWSELRGSTKFTLSHDEALANAGYEVVRELNDYDPGFDALLTELAATPVVLPALPSGLDK